MGIYNLAAFTKKLYDSRLSFFTLDALRDIFAIEKDGSFYDVVKRLREQDVLEKIERNKYVLKGATQHTFFLANFLYQPSYISCETALNLYGILPQFPYVITSVTLRKPNKKKIHNQLFEYTHMQRKLFFGYEKKDGYLIAVPEKALLDQAYLAAKGLRRFPIDEYDLSSLNNKKIQEYLTFFPKTRQFITIVYQMKQYMDI